MRFTEEENNYCLELYFLSSNSISKAIDMFYDRYQIRLAPSTMRRKWKDAGYEINQHGGARAVKKDVVHSSPCWNVRIEKSKKKYLEERCRVVLR